MAKAKKRASMEDYVWRHAERGRYTEKNGRRVREVFAYGRWHILTNLAYHDMARFYDNVWAARHPHR